MDGLVASGLLAYVNPFIARGWIGLGLHSSAQFGAEAEGRNLFLEANGVTIQSLWMGNVADFPWFLCSLFLCPLSLFPSSFNFAIHHHQWNTVRYVVVSFTRLPCA